MWNPSILTDVRAETHTEGNPFLQLRDVIKVYSSAAGGFRALDDINLDVHSGEFLGIIGKSGAGKTTLLNMISGVSELSAGEVLYYPPQNNGYANPVKPISVHAMNENDMALWRGKNLGIVYQSFELLPQMDLVNNIMLPQDFTGSFQAKISRERAFELLDLVELSEHAYKKPAHVSGGQKQRVAIARALVNDPPLILADEPTGNLDTVTAETIYRIFEKLVARGKTVIMVTHDMNLSSRFSRWVRITDGALSEQGSRMMASKEPETAPSNGKGDAIEVVSNLAAVVPDLTVVPDRAYQALGEVKPGSQNGNPAIILRDVYKTYKNAAGEFPALKGISMQMNFGQFVSIVGKSGSGKSTLLNMLTGIDHPTTGEVIIGGEQIYKMSESKRALWRGRNMGIVFQFFQLLPTLTLLENTILPMDYCNVYPVSERTDRALELLRMVGLEAQADKLPGSVSSGQQQSAAIARALANDPPIIVADEPTGNLDSRSADNILRLFAELAGRGKTILLVTHDPSFTKRTKQTVILSDGEIIDETVARALPMLDHPLMLAATHKAKRQEFTPGATILRQGDTVEYFYMVAKGEVDIILNKQNCPEACLARLGPGQFFGEVELTNGGSSVASVRAGMNETVELALLEREHFLHLLDGSPSTRHSLEEVAQTRLEENRSHSEECA